MKCVDFAGAFGLTCKPVSAGLIYLQTPMADSVSGRLFGFFVQELGRGLLRFSDNADTLFNIMCAGVRPSSARGRNLADVAHRRGVTLSDGGELHLTCPEGQAGFYIARFVETMLSVSASCEQWLPVEKGVSKFEKQVRAELKAAFPKELKTNFEIIGASGNQLKFNFAIAPDTNHGSLIQLIPAQGDRHYWPTIYSTVGKMVDVKNIRPGLRRFAIIEDSETVETARAGSVIAQFANVIHYGAPGNLGHQLAIH